MAQVKFHGMLLDFQFVKECYDNSTFNRFIFQSYMPDSAQWQEEFLLLVYAMDDKGEVLEKRDLTVVMDDPFYAPQRLDMGNIAMTRLQLRPFIEEDGSGQPLKDLYLKPFQFGEYVAYNVTGVEIKTEAQSGSADGGLVTDTQVDIKPSPPAPPEP